MTALGRALKVALLTLSLIFFASPLMALEPVSFGPPQDLTIRSGGMVTHFQVQVASDHAQREYGLMNRTSLEPNAGMLFDFHRLTIVRMWMKDTLIPLDMVYIDDTGTVVSIEKEAQPGDLTPRGPEAPVLAVLELAGGTADHLNIQIGDKIEHPMFSNAKRPSKP